MITNAGEKKKPSRNKNYEMSRRYGICRVPMYLGTPRNLPRVESGGFSLGFRWKSRYTDAP